jgi:hypothetical protein
MPAFASSRPSSTYPGGSRYFCQASFSQQLTRPQVQYNNAPSKFGATPSFATTGLFGQNRNISLFRSKPAPASPVLRLAKIARLEADADAHAHDVARQVALFMELASIDSRTGYQGIVSRWERMCEFVSLPSKYSMSHYRNGYFIKDPRSPLLRSDIAFELYLTALIRLGLPQSVNPAVRRREALLALPPLDPETLETPTESSAPPSASEVIAQRVLSNSSIKLGVGRALLNDSPTPTTLGAAAARATGDNAGSSPFGNRGSSGADPVHVVIEERKPIKLVCATVYLLIFYFSPQCSLDETVPFCANCGGVRL